MLPQEIERILRLFPCFSSVALEDWGNANVSIIQVPVAPVMDEGHLFAHASFVLEGTVRIYKIGQNGREVTLYRVRRGELCVLMMASILGDVPYVAAAEVEEAAELFVVPVGLFKKWMDAYPELNQFIYRLFIQRMISVTDLLEDVAFQPVDYRLAELLLSRCTGPSSILRVTHEELAVELGTAREVVSRKLKEFENEGLLQLGRGRIDNIETTRLRHKLSRFM